MLCAIEPHWLYTQTFHWHILQLSFLYKTTPIRREHAASESINIQLCCKNKCNMHGAFIFGLVWLGCGVCIFLLLFSIYILWIRIQNNVPYAGGLERGIGYTTRRGQYQCQIHFKLHITAAWVIPPHTVPLRNSTKNKSTYRILISHWTKLHLSSAWHQKPWALCIRAWNVLLELAYSSGRCLKYSDNEYFIVFVHDIHKVFCYFRVFCWYLKGCDMLHVFVLVWSLISSSIYIIRE